VLSSSCGPSVHADGQSGEHDREPHDPESGDDRLVGDGPSDRQGSDGIDDTLTYLDRAATIFGKAFA